MIKKFEQYNESLRDKMTPKTDEEIIKSFGKMTPNKKVENGYQHNILWLAEEGIAEGGDPDPFGNYFSNALSNGYIDIVRHYVDNKIGRRFDYNSWGLNQACGSGNAELVDLLINEYNWDISSINLTKCLGWIKKGYIDMMKVITEKSPELKEKLKVKADKLIAEAEEIKKCI